MKNSSYKDIRDIFASGIDRIANAEAIDKLSEDISDRAFGASSGYSKAAYDEIEVNLNTSLSESFEHRSRTNAILAAISYSAIKKMLRDAAVTCLQIAITFGIEDRTFSGIGNNPISMRIPVDYVPSQKSLAAWTSPYEFLDELSQCIASDAIYTMINAFGVYGTYERILGELSGKEFVKEFESYATQITKFFLGIDPESIGGSVTVILLSYKDSFAQMIVNSESSDQRQAISDSIALDREL